MCKNIISSMSAAANETSVLKQINANVVFISVIDILDRRGYWLTYIVLTEIGNFHFYIWV